MKNNYLHIILLPRCAKSPDFELSRPQVGVENKMGKKKKKRKV